MNKNSYLASVLLAGSLFFGSLSVQAQDRTIKLTTQKPAGEAVTLLVNYTYKGVTVDWGDGQPVVYNTGKEPIREITGTVKGSTITITVCRLRPDGYRPHRSTRLCLALLPEQPAHHARHQGHEGTDGP